MLVSASEVVAGMFLVTPHRLRITHPRLAASDLYHAANIPPSQEGPACANRHIRKLSSGCRRDGDSQASDLNLAFLLSLRVGRAFAATICLTPYLPGVADAYTVRISHDIPSDRHRLVSIAKLTGSDHNSAGLTHGFLGLGCRNRTIVFSQDKSADDSASECLETAGEGLEKENRAASARPAAVP